MLLNYTPQAHVMTKIKNKIVWHIHKGDLVRVKIFAPQGEETRQGIVISEKFDDENTMFPCVDVYIFGLNHSHRCMPHQLEILSSVS